MRLRDAIRGLTRSREQRWIDALSGRPVHPSVERRLRAAAPRDAWHSWDPAPWSHPWLTRENLEAARAFQDGLLADLERRVPERDARSLRYGFAGNLANNMAIRALPLRRQGYDIDVVLHPADRYVMSQPGWELFDGTLPGSETNVDRLQEQGFELPAFEGVVETSISRDGEELILAAKSASARSWPRSHPAAAFLRQTDVLSFQGFMGYLPTFEALRAYDAVLAAQTPYLALFSGRPYLAAQTGGDLWLEAARDDAFGRLQRRSYAEAGAILATNPWAYAHARRYGFHHVLYVPLLVDTETFRPGPSPERAAWQERVGGDFFVLATARVDRMWKGSEIGLEGFRRFAERHPGARLVLIGWGEDKASGLEDLAVRGLGDRIVTLPVSGKRKLADYLRGADCLLDQFKIGYYGATALEALSSGLPVVMRLLAAHYDGLCPTGAPPVLHASAPAEVADALARLAGSADEREEVARRSRGWIERNHSVGVWGRHYGALLRATARGPRIDFTGSPLHRPLAPDEAAYHAEMLATAPPFGEYEI